MAGYNPLGLNRSPNVERDKTIAVSVLAGVKTAELSKTFGLSRQRISQIVQKYQRKLKASTNVPS